MWHFAASTPPGRNDGAQAAEIAMAVLQHATCMSKRPMRLCNLGCGVLAAGLLIGGCSDNDDGDVQKAGEGWRAAGQVFSKSSADFQQAIEPGADGTITATCPDGGEVGIDGTFDGDDKYELNLSLSNCIADGVVMNGQLSMSATVTVTGNSSEVVFDYVGHLDFSGEVELDCAIDVEGRVVSSVSDDGATAQAEFSGHVCGVSADAAIQASAG